MVLHSPPYEVCSTVQKAQALGNVRHILEQPEHGNLRTTVGIQGHLGRDGPFNMDYGEEL